MLPIIKLEWTSTLYKEIRIESKKDLRKLESIVEKLNHLCLSLKINLEEKKMFSNNNENNLFDNVIDFLIEYSEELSIQVNTSEVGDKFVLTKSTIKMLESMIEFYEKEIKESNREEIRKELSASKELLEYA
jgi:cob(I)alamin adenosyltransferase